MVIRPVACNIHFLRAEPSSPTCERNVNVDNKVQQQMKADAADEYADFFGVRSEADVRAAILQAQQVCEESYQFYDKAVAHTQAHPSIRAYRTFETSFFGIFKFGTKTSVRLRYWSLWWYSQRSVPR